MVSSGFSSLPVRRAGDKRVVAGEEAARVAAFTAGKMPALHWTVPGSARYEKDQNLFAGLD